MNQWIKLAVASLTGIVISFSILWGIQQFEQNRYYNGYNQQQYQSGMNTQSGMNMQGYNANGEVGMNVQSNSGMNMQDTSGMNVQSSGSMSSQGSNMGMPMMDDKMMGMDKMMGTDKMMGGM